MGTVDIPLFATLADILPGKGTASPQSQGWIVSSVSGTPTDAQIIAGLLGNQDFGIQLQSMAGSNVVAWNLKFGFDETTPVFSLDGNAFISFNDLPAGIIFTSLSIILRIKSEAQNAGTTPGEITFEVDPIVSVVTLPTTVDPDPQFNQVYTFDLVAELGTPITPTEFINIKVILGGSYDSGAGPNNTDFKTAFDLTQPLVTMISGIYEIQQFKFSLDTESPVSVGDTITISAPKDPNALPLDDINEIDVNYTTLDNMEHTITLTAADFIFQGPFLLTFIVPDFGDAPEVSFDAGGTSFSGKVPLGPLLTINFVDGTGIYRLDTSATHDTLYIQDYTPVQTINVKIPNPTIKTGYVP